MKKRILALLLAIVMVFGLVACNNDSPEEADTPVENNPVSEDNAPEDTAPAAPVEVEYPLVKEGEEVTLKGAVIVHSIPEIEDRLVWQAVEEVTGVNIEWEFVLLETINTYLAANEWPDFILTCDGGAINDTLMYDYGIIGERFVNLFEHLNEMPNLTQFLEDYPEARKAFTESNGEMYEFPGLDGMVTAVYSRPYMRTDVLEEAGLEVPTTIDEFYDCLVKLKEFYGHESWLYKQSETNSFFPIVFGAFGPLTEATFEDDGTGNILFVRSSEQMRLYYEFMNKLYEEGLINQECFTIDWNTAYESEMNGGYAFLEYAGEALGVDQLKDGNFEYLTCLEPLTSQYDSTQQVMGRMGLMSRSGPYLNAESEHIDLMCKLFDIMYATEEVVEGSGLHGMSFFYGIEGEHWSFDDNGTTYTQYWPDTYTSFGKFQTSEIVWQNAGRGDALAGYVTSTPGNAQARAISFVEKVWPYVKDSSEVFPMAFLKFTEDEQFVIDQYWSEIKTYYTEMEAKFITGTVDIATGWDEYVNTLDKMGLAEVLEVYQAAYDRWLSY